ncbi:hypothetical protein ONZ51_g2666 [Trametes cubensis]|uniref:Wax synthase domain-containing protein n=1 Tax=Trametes cubensis TaxID=1111947 RepID=A0AAD7XEM8_9APHY|nr:hypothetical protein ONZ51_g2666 [Trametes cubensis]
MGYADMPGAIQLDAAYATRRPPLPLLTFVVLPEIALACVIALRPPFTIRIGAALLLLYTAFYAASSYTLGTPADDYGLGSSFYGNMVLNVMFLVTDPLKDIRYLKDPAPLTTKPLFKRIGYALCILRNYRLIGTNAQVANVPPPFKGTRSQFLRRRFWQLVVTIITFDITESWVHMHPHLYMPSGSDSDAVNLHFPAGPVGYLARSACMAVWLVMIYSLLRLLYFSFSFAVVAAHLADPEDWPDVFGTWSDAYTVRHLWGRAWHQNLRRHFSYWGKLSVQVHIAFALSALLHCMGDLMVGKEHFGRSWAYFAANGLAITLEDTVFALAKRAGFATHQTGRPSRTLRLLGYVWVFLWCTWSAQLYQRKMWEIHVGVDYMLPYSPIRSLVLPALQHIIGTKP